MQDVWSRAVGLSKPLSDQTVPLVHHKRPCMFCGRTAYVIAPADASDLDVEAEFASTGRAFGDDNETVGVSCHGCARKHWGRAA